MKTDRLIAMIMLLLERRRVSAKTLADMFEVSSRTIYRDIDTINQAGVPIVSIPGVGGGFQIMPEYKIDKKIFSTNDLSTLLLGLTSLPVLGNCSEIANTLAKIKSLIPAEHESMLAIKASQTVIDLTPWTGNQHFLPYLTQIKAMIQQQRQLSFTYIDRLGVRSERQIEPYQLVLKENSWYLHGFCLLRQNFRLFKLSRIDHLTEHDDSFTLRPLPDRIFDCQTTEQKPPIMITLLVDNTIKDRLLDYCSNEQMTPYDEQQMLVKCPFFADEFSYNFLLSFGDKCECIEPAEIRAEISNRIQKMAARYQLPMSLQR